MSIAAAAVEDDPLMMTNDVHMQSLITCLMEDYSPEQAQALANYGEAAVHPLLAALRRRDVDPYGHDTFAEILIGILKTTRHPRTVDLLTHLLEHENADVRRRVVRLLGETRDRRVVLLLRVALYDRNDLVREAAAQALITLRYGSRICRAYRAALYDDEPCVRYYAVRQLERLRSIDALIDATYTEDPVVRQIAVWHLGRVSARKAVPALIDALNDHDPEVRGGAAWALGNLGDPRAADALVPLLEDSQRTIAQLATGALYKLGRAPESRPTASCSPESAPQ